MAYRKHGAQKGNKNALKHGLYSKHYDDETKKILCKWDPLNWIAEIQLLRVIMDKITKDTFASKDKSMHVKQLNAIAMATATLVQTGLKHALLNGDDNPVLTAWSATLDEENFFEDGEPPG